MEETSTAVALPHILIEVLPHNALFLSSPTQSIIVSKESGEILYTLTHARILQAPRCSSVHSLQGPQLEGDAFDCLIALLGDDKVLKVYKISGLSAQNVNMDKIFSSPLPKRGVKMVWEQTSEKERTLIVGDRHGDVRSFDIPLINDEKSVPVAKRRKIEGKEGDEDDDELDSTNPPHLGHVSMLTDFVMTSFTSDLPQAPASFIITSDRDEHIRISRWGSRRAGHIALRYLLGSTAAIGGICVVEHNHIKASQQAAQTDEAKNMCRQPLLLSTDSSRLRIWSLHKDAEVSTRQDCLLVVDLYDVVERYVKVDQQKEKDRQRWHGKGKTDTKRKGAPTGEEAAASVEEAKVEKDGERRPIVMLRLTAMETKGDLYISFLVDGSSGLFTFSLSKMIASSREEATSFVQVLDMGLPILSQAAEPSCETPCLWLTCDVRHIAADGVKQQGLRRVVWSHESSQWVEDRDGSILVQKQDNLHSQGTSDFANSLLLYDALTLYPKHEFELSDNVQDAISPNGLVRGGLTSFDTLGQRKGGSIANKMNTQRAAGKKVKAREVMLKRIEQTLEGTDIKDKPQ